MINVRAEAVRNTRIVAAKMIDILVLAEQR